MEARTVNEVRLYKLVLNNMQAPKIEMGTLVAVSGDYDKLVNWYKSQLAPAMWRDGRWGKTFAQGTPLEWYNPASSLELNDTYPFGQGISDEWVRESSLPDIMNRFTFIE